MAIEVNKRKRKHKSDENEEDEGAVAVPIKVAKKNKTPKKQKKLNKSEVMEHSETMENQEEIPVDGEVAEVLTKLKKVKTPKKQKKNKSNVKLDASEEAVNNAEIPVDDEGMADFNEEQQDSQKDPNQDSGFEPDEKEQKFSKDFKMLNFRTKLRGNNFITELRHFLHLTQVRPKIVAKYIEKRGKPLELAEALERIDKTNVLHVAYLCEALQLVTMEILSNQKSHLESAVHAARYFLKSHGSILELLLKSSQLKHRCTALKLLTAIVCVEPQLGRQVLSTYDILSNVKTIENFLSHSKYELHEEETVRKCFIHFVLAYLVDGNTLLIRNILDRGTLIRALASGLIYDDHVTVCVVLSTLRKYVLECVEISKTKKIHVFDLDCVKHFARLYDWHGPKVFSAKFSNNKTASGQGAIISYDEINRLVDKSELEAVAETVHEFLQVLLTSRKYGITFDAMAHFRQKHNVLQGKLIGALYKPWCNARKTELVVKILQACPDLARNTVRNYAHIVNPMRTKKVDWVNAVNFVAKIIEALHPSLLHNALDKITLTDFSYWIKDICLPVETLVLLTGSKQLSHTNFEFRLATNRLLLVMFTQYSNYMAAISKREQAKSGGNTLRRFKFDILNHILVNFPTIEDILYSLYMSIKSQDNADVNVLEHLEITLDLVLIICKENRSFVNKTNTILDYLKLLRPLYANDGTTPTTAEDRGNIKLELKAIKTILLLFPKALEPREELFSGVLVSFIRAFVYGEAAVQREAGFLLRGIFKNTGIFDSGLYEIDLWLEALRFFDAETVEIVTQVLVEVLQVTKAPVEVPEIAETITNDKNLQKLFANIENGLSVQAYIETLSISKLLPLIYKGVEIAKPLDKYLETVCLLMYHYYPIPEHVLRLYEMKFKGLKKYMRSWLAAAPIAKDVVAQQLEGKIADVVPKLKQLHMAVVQPNQVKFEDIFRATGDAGIELEINGKLVKLDSVLKNERIVMLYVQAILFLIAQLAERQQLQRKQAECAAAYLINLLNVVRQQEKSVDICSGAADMDEESYMAQILKYIFSIRLSYIRSAELFAAGDDTHASYLHFLCELTENCNTMPNFNVYAVNYRLKIVKAAAISLQNKAATITQSDKLTASIKLLQAFNLDAENCIEILELLATQLKYDDFFVDKQTLQKSFYYELIVAILQRLSVLQAAVPCADYVHKIFACYTDSIQHLGADIQLESLEEAFYNFLLVSHACITQLQLECFACFFAERKLTKSSIRLACLLLERDQRLDAEFLVLLPIHIGKKELIYPLLKIACDKRLSIEPALWQSLYQAFKNGFMKTIEKPQKAGVIYKENVECSIALIEQCMPKSECLDFCQKNFKFEHIEPFQMRIIQAIYKKALASVTATDFKQCEQVFVNFINIQIQMLAVDLKKQLLTQEKLELSAYALYAWWQQAPSSQTDDVALDFSRILSSQQWLNFCKTCLKLGMQLNEAETASLDTEQHNGLLLKLLAYLCEQLYADNASEAPAEPAQLFEMICTHSKFHDIILSQRTNYVVKTELLHLLYTLAKKSSAALSMLQIPVLLGAYQARLFAADRYALALLQLYELYDAVNLQKYRPFVWGESAIAFYALHDADVEQRAQQLKQPETSIMQVMSLIDRQICDYSIDNFPIWRKLNTLQQMPSVRFEQPALHAFRAFGANALEQRIELSLVADVNDKEMSIVFDENDLRLCPKRDGIFEQCYDPAFFLPLMSMCFAPEAFVHPARPVQNGMLAVIFASLSSQDKDMRLAAGCVQLRYRSHFEHSKFFERPLWQQAYDNIQAGLADLRSSWMQHKKNSGTPRVPFISCLFVAKTFNLTNDPTHLLYKQLTMYLRLKSSFNFQCVPEFNVLFYSLEMEHHAFRQFIVEVIRNGIKSSSDLFLLVSTNTFKVLMGFYGGTMSTLELNLLILSVFSTCVKIPASTKIMIEHVGILPWLSSIISALEFYHFDIIEGLISILNNLWYALKANAAEFHNYAHLNLELHRLLLLLLPHMSARIAPANFAKLLNILQKTAVIAQRHMSISAAQLDKLLDCAEKHFPTHVHSLCAIKSFGGAGAATHAQYCQQLQLLDVSPNAIVALSSLRAYIIDWWQCHHVSTTTTINA